MPSVIRTTAVDDDLLGIWLYIARDNEAAADQHLDKIHDKCQLYATHPEMGEARHDLAPGVRVFPVDGYVVFYRQVEEGIELLLVTEGSRNIPPLIFDRLKDQ